MNLIDEPFNASDIGLHEMQPATIENTNRESVGVEYQIGLKKARPSLI